MRSFIYLFAGIVALACSAFAQQPAPTPPPSPPPSQTPQPTQTSQPVRPLSLRNRFPSAFDKQPEISLMARRQLLIQQFVMPLYRRPTSKELRLLAPDAAVMSTYRTFLGRPDTGIVRLVRDAGCSQNAKVVSASEECLKYSLPGAGNAFSFRTENYRIRHLADIVYTADGFDMPGILMNALMVDLGKLPIESVGISDAAIVNLASIEPAGDIAGAAKIEKIVVAGIIKEGKLYRRSLPVVPGHTYALRSIAYRGKVMRSVRGADYNELDFDKRHDVIVVFNIADVGEDGSVTLVWTKLLRRDAPKLRVPKTEAVETARSQ